MADKIRFSIAKGNINSIPSQMENDKVYVGISSGNDSVSKIIIDGKEWTSKEYVDNLETEVLRNELVTAAALNDLNDRKQDVIEDIDEIRENAANINNKQDKLVSGVSIKTINKNSILGNGDIEIIGKPQNGWLKSDLSSGVQDSLDKADSALQEVPSTIDKNITFNGNVYASNLYLNEDELLSDVIEEIELVTAAALNDLNDKEEDILDDLDIIHESLERISELDNKQDKLVSGESIKTINGESILGSGDIETATKEDITELENNLLEIEDVTSKSLEKIIRASGILQYNSDVVAYNVDVTSSYIKDANSLHDATVILDKHLNDVEQRLSESGKVNDVKISGKSVVNDKVANIPLPSINGNNGIISNNKCSLNIESDNIPISKTSYSEIEYPSPFDKITYNQTIIREDSVSNAFHKVENVISSLVNEVLKNEDVTTKSIEKLSDCVGINEYDGKIEYIPNEGTHYISESKNIVNALDILDDKLYDIINNVIKEKLQKAFDAFIEANPTLNNIIVE